MKRIAVLLIGVVALAGCGNEAAKVTPTQDADIYISKIRLPDGRSVTCAVYSDRQYDKGGLSCDWENAQ